MTEKKWLSRTETSQALRISLSTLNRMVKAGIIKSPFITYIGRRVLFDADLPSLINSFTRGHTRSVIGEIKNA